MFGDNHFDKDINAAEDAFRKHLDKLEEAGRFPDFISREKSQNLVYTFLEGFENGWEFEKIP